ncbi:response regulator [Maricaulis sp.]|uniref:response regulator n=1 Tax=Maricaulis sp. TaxID=1486257 RepID=UPI003A8D7F7B
MSDQHPGHLPLRVVVVDDHAIVRDAVSAVIEMSDAFELAGTASNGTEALELLGRVEADVAVIDFAMPDMTGVDVINKLRDKGTETRFLLLTGSHMDEDERERLSRCAEGFLHKEAGRQTLIEAIRAVADAPCLRPAPGDQMDMSGVLGTGDLTGRERDILREIARGHSVDQIADKLGISAATVRKHRENIMGKLELNSTSQLVRAAMQIGQY